MRRLVLIAFLLAAPVLCLASEAASDVPAAQVTGTCKTKVTETPVTEAAASTDAPVRRAESPSRPANVASPGHVRPPTPRWNRLLPGMFR